MKPTRTDALSRFIALAKPEAAPIVLGTLCLVVASASGLAFPQAIRFIIDETLRGGNLASIDRAALAMAAIFAVQGIAVALRYSLFSRAGERVVARLRRELFTSLMKQEIAFFDAQKTGELVNRLSADTAVLQNTVSSNVSMVLRNAAAVLGGLVLLLYTSPKLTGLMLLIVPPVAIGAVAYGRRVRALSQSVQDALARSTEVAEEALAGIRTVRSFAAESRESARFGEAVDASLDLAFRRIRLAATFIGAASFAAYAAGALVFWYGGRMVARREMSVGALTSFLVYTLLVAFSLGALSDLWADFNRAVGASTRVFELLERTPGIPTTGGQRLPLVQGRITWQGVAFAYPTRPDARILDGFELTIEPGQVVALVGPSGAGKSTVAALLYRLYDPDAGEVQLDGVPLTALEPDWLRDQVGVVAQEPLLFSASIAENIRYGNPAATREDIERAARFANAHTFIEGFAQGYETNVGERGVQLSGGQKQRVAIARAVLKDPRVLVLDEATSALDAESEHHVREALERLMKGRTTLVIAHRLSTVRNADRVVVIEGGRVTQSGTHDALAREDGRYRQLVERQLASLT